ncbi:podocan-like [Dasypus novemcinctus]|uniref:podocan-like n=1 Tax=Dasypus novemcinctus TaxID=9361 RepID=UPI00265F4B16|nr:uncharacterized protein LOC111763346 [Dasypus novemcinctus]
MTLPRAGSRQAPGLSPSRLAPAAAPQGAEVKDGLSLAPEEDGSPPVVGKQQALGLGLHRPWWDPPVALGGWPTPRGPRLLLHCPHPAAPSVGPICLPPHPDQDLVHPFDRKAGGPLPACPALSFPSRGSRPLAALGGRLALSPGGTRSLHAVAMRLALLPVLALWVGCSSGGPRGPAAPPPPAGLPTPSPSSLSRAPDGQARSIPGNGMDGPQAWPNSKERAPSWKLPTRPVPAQGKELPPAAWEREQGPPHARKLRPSQASRATKARDSAVPTEKGQDRTAGGRGAGRRGLRARRPPKGLVKLPRPGRHRWKAYPERPLPGFRGPCAGLCPWCLGQQAPGPGSVSRPARASCPPGASHQPGPGGSSTPVATDHGRKRPGRGQGPTGPGAVEPAMPSLPASCLLAQTAIACANVQMEHIPVLRDPGLTTLYLAENEIATIPAHAFLGLPNLEWLDLSKNKLDARGLHPHAFKNLSRLKRLNLDGNSLSTIPALPASLQELKFNDNLLQGLQRSSFRGLSQLLTLEVEGNQLHDGNISPLAFQPLHSLLYLRLDRNRLRAIPPGLPASLQELHLATNHIEEVTEGVLSRSHSLSVLVLSNNRLQEDRLAPRAWIDLPKLETLDLSHNRLVHVPSFLPRGLRRLALHHNHIERIPGYVFAHMKPGLEFLQLSHNRLRDDGIHGVSFLGLRGSLAELLLDNNQLQAVPRGLLGLKGLQVLRLSHNKIRHVPLNSICDTRVAQDSNLVSTHLENNLIDRRRVPPSAFSCIRAYHSVVLQPQQGEAA